MTARKDGISRRESFRRAGLLGLGTGLPFSFTAAAETAPWNLASLEPVQAPGYGTDPDLVHPSPIPWPRTLTDPELETLSALADILIPEEGERPAASGVGVVDVIDEWISAPYPTQQQHRSLLLAGFDWCDREAARQSGVPFAEAGDRIRLQIVDAIAYPDRPGPAELEGPRRFFDVLRSLVAGAYYTSPEGVRELGYQGNVPITGDYPGPSDEAMAHLKARLEALGLTLD